MRSSLKRHETGGDKACKSEFKCETICETKANIKAWAPIHMSRAVVQQYRIYRVLKALAGDAKYISIIYNLRKDRELLYYKNLTDIL